MRDYQPDEVIHYCDHHAGTMAGSATRLNPYKLGLELYRDIEDRWNRGRYGKQYDQCDDMTERRTWDTGAGRGRDDGAENDRTDHRCRADRRMPGRHGCSLTPRGTGRIHWCPGVIAVAGTVDPASGLPSCPAVEGATGGASFPPVKRSMK